MGYASSSYGLERPEAPAAGQRIAYEVHGPDRVGSRGTYSAARSRLGRRLRAARRRFNRIALYTR